MSEISITRFQPAAIGRDKATSVKAVDELSVASDTDSSTDQRGAGTGKDKDRHGADKSPYQGQPQSTTSQNSTAQPFADGAGTNSALLTPEARLEQAVSKLNRYVQTVQRDIYFDLDPLSGEPSVTVLDRESRQVLRQFQSSEALELASKVDSDEPITLFKTKV